MNMPSDTVSCKMLRQCPGTGVSRPQVKGAVGGGERCMVNVCLKMFAVAKALSQSDMDKKKDQSMCRGGTRHPSLQPHGLV